MVYRIWKWLQVLYCLLRHIWRLYRRSECDDWWAVLNAAVSFADRTWVVVRCVEQFVSRGRQRRQQQRRRWRRREARPASSRHPPASAASAASAAAQEALAATPPRRWTLPPPVALQPHDARRPPHGLLRRQPLALQVDVPPGRLPAERTQHAAHREYLSTSTEYPTPE